MTTESTLKKIYWIHLTEESTSVCPSNNFFWLRKAPKFMNLLKTTALSRKVVLYTVAFAIFCSMLYVKCFVPGASITLFIIHISLKLPPFSDFVFYFVLRQYSFWSSHVNSFLVRQDVPSFPLQHNRVFLFKQQCCWFSALFTLTFRIFLITEKMFHQLFNTQSVSLSLNKYVKWTGEDRQNLNCRVFIYIWRTPTCTNSYINKQINKNNN